MKLLDYIRIRTVDRRMPLAEPLEIGSEVPETRTLVMRTAYTNTVMFEADLRVVASVHVTEPDAVRCREEIEHRLKTQIMRHIYGEVSEELHKIRFEVLMNRDREALMLIDQLHEMITKVKTLRGR